MSTLSECPYVFYSLSARSPRLRALDECWRWDQIVVFGGWWSFGKGFGVICTGWWWSSTAMPCPIYRVTPRIPQAQGILVNRQNQVQVGFNFFSCSSSNPHALRNDKTILNLEKSSLLGRTVSLSLVTWKIFTASPYISRIVLLLAQAGIPSCRPPFPHESGKHFPSQHGFRLSWNRNKKIRN